MRKTAGTWPLQIVIATGASLGLLFFSLGGCKDEEEANAPVSPQEAPPSDPQGTIHQEPSKQPPPTSSVCEELGNWSGPTLIAKLRKQTASSPQSESFNVALANRPVPSRIGIIALGSRDELLGKPSVLGTGLNSKYESCTHCFAIAIGCNSTDCSKAAWFYPKSGSALFTAVATQNNEKFEGTFTDVILEQVSIDFIAGVSSPVPGGACIHVGQLTFSATATSNTPVEDGGGSTAKDAGQDAPQGDPGTSTSGGGDTSSGGCGLFAGLIGCDGKVF